MRNRRRNRYAIPSLLLVFFALAACGDDPLTIESLAGQYVMIDAAGQPLPASIQTSDTLEIEVTGGTLVLLASAQYSFSVDFRFSDPQMPGDSTTVEFIDVGPWDIANEALSLQSTTPGRTWVGEVDGSRISIEITEPDFLERSLEITYRRESS